MGNRMSPLHGGTALTAIRAIEPDVTTSGTVNGQGIDLGGKRGAIFVYQAGTLGTNATVNGYLQDSSDNSVWTNVAGRSITEIDEASSGTDSAGEALNYGGPERYVRAVLVLATATSDVAVAAAMY